MNEYVIGFINEQGVYQELTFRGVTESVATAFATGLLTAGFQQVFLVGKEDRPIAILPADPVPGASGGTGPAEPEVAPEPEVVPEPEPAPEPAPEGASGEEAASGGTGAGE